MEKRNTFIIHVEEQKNATWQGTITWVAQQQKENFRSLLELIKLMDAVLEKRAD